MNKEKNVYILIYASVLVVLVALILAITAEVLHKQQAKNEAIDKMRQILSSLNIASDNKNAEALYNVTIGEAYLINNQGNKVDGDAFSVELTEEMQKPLEERKYPVFEAFMDGQKKYIFSLRGAGLWGPIWGFISLNDDKNTIYGASFGHESETPGLGAEIATSAFANRFLGKKIFNNYGQFTSVAIVKFGRTAEGKDYVDGISGGTITSRGVDAMMYSSLKFYESFLSNQEQSK